MTLDDECYRPSFNNQVFINCPFDKEFKPIFQSFCFTVQACGFYPVTALDEFDSSQNRIDKILHLIDKCKYSIHDLTRIELDKSTQLPRFNMPFEFGVDYSRKHFSKGKAKSKVFVVFEPPHYKSQAFLSDIAGVDKMVHDYSTTKAISALYKWLNKQVTYKIPGPKIIAESFREFQESLPSICNDQHLDSEDLDFVDLINLIFGWLYNYPKILSDGHKAILDKTYNKYRFP